MQSEVVTFADLARFHRDVIVPDIRLIVRAEVTQTVAWLTPMLGGMFDDRLEHRLAPFVGELGSIRREVGEVRDELTDLRRDVLTHFDAVYTRLDAMAVEQVAITGGVRRLEDRVTELENNVR